MDPMRLSPVTDRIGVLLAQKPRVIVAIDGPCAAGKSTLAAALRGALGADVLHMDDFFLRPEQRTPERYAEPGGNLDRERFLAEALRPLREGRPFSYRPFDCGAMRLGVPVFVRPGRLSIAEGSYSLHPDLAWAYDLRIFLRVSPGEQRRRILAREGERAGAFFSRWIPLEERYFEALRPDAQADLVLTL